jgi:hypothetical protein
MLDVVIPTVGRADRLGPLVANLFATAPMAHQFYVLDEGDQESHEAILEAVSGLGEHPRVSVLRCDGTYPQKTNYGFSRGDGEWVLPTADDVKFHDNWLQEAELAMSIGADVIGTNDLSGMSAQRPTMPIVRRSYAEDPGAAWGEEGTLFSEQYHHNFVDNELWSLAVVRGVATYAPNCVIEHLHPSFGKAEVDATYRKGGLNLERWAHDEELFNDRKAQWG